MSYSSYIIKIKARILAFNNLFITLSMRLMKVKLNERKNERTVENIDGVITS